MTNLEAVPDEGVLEKVICLPYAGSIALLIHVANQNRLQDVTLLTFRQLHRKTKMG